MCSKQAFTAAGVSAHARLAWPLVPTRVGRSLRAAPRERCFTGELTRWSPQVNVHGWSPACRHWTRRPQLGSAGAAVSVGDALHVAKPRCPTDRRAGLAL